MPSKIGVELDNIDLAKGVDNETAVLIRSAFVKHSLVIFRDQDLTPTDLLTTARLFGKVGHYPFAKSMPDYPGVVEIIKDPQQTSNFGGIWHTDTAYLESPPRATLLYAKQTPPTGGDTCFASMYTVFNSLSEDEYELLHDRCALHSSSLTADKVRGDHLSSGSMQAVSNKADSFTASHPLLKTHPESNKTSVYISPAHTVCIVGLPLAHSNRLLNNLYTRATQKDNVYSLNWQVGTLVIWDNRVALHKASNDYNGYRRHMQRVTIQ